MWSIFNKSGLSSYSHGNREIKVMSEAVSNWKRTRTLLTETVIYFLRGSNSALKIANTEYEFVGL